MMVVVVVINSVVNRAVGVDGRHFSQPFDNIDKIVNDVFNIFHSSMLANGQSQRAVGNPGRQANGQQYMRRIQ